MRIVRLELLRENALVDDGWIDQVDDLVDICLVRAEIHKRFERLTERQRIAVTMRYGLDGCGPRSFSAIGRAIGRSAECARYTNDVAIRKLVGGGRGRSELRRFLGR